MTNNKVNDPQPFSPLKETEPTSEDKKTISEEVKSVSKKGWGQLVWEFVIVVAAISAIGVLIYYCLERYFDFSVWSSPLAILGLVFLAIIVLAQLLDGVRELFSTAVDAYLTKK